MQFLFSQFNDHKLYCIINFKDDIDYICLKKQLISPQNISIKYNPYFQLGPTTFSDELSLSINFYGTHADRIKINSFLVELKKELSNLGRSKVT